MNGLARSEEHTSELQSQFHLVCRLLLEKKNSSVHESWSRALDLKSWIPALLAASSMCLWASFSAFFFFNDTPTTEIYTLSLHDALPISPAMASPFPAAAVAHHPGPPMA